MVRKILYSLAALIALVLGTAAVLPSAYTVTRQVRIQATREAVFSKIDDYAKWKEWSPWYEREPSAQVNFSGTASQLGYTMHWSGKEIGEGSLILKNMEAPSRLESELQFVSPKMSSASDQWSLVAVSDQETLVTWTNQGTLAWPLDRIVGLFLNRMLGGEMERGLTKLKNISEGAKE